MTTKKELHQISYEIAGLLDSLELKNISPEITIKHMIGSNIAFIITVYDGDIDGNLDNVSMIFSEIEYVNWFDVSMEAYRSIQTDDFEVVKETFGRVGK